MKIPIRLSVLLVLVLVASSSTALHLSRVAEDVPELLEETFALAPQLTATVEAGPETNTTMPQIPSYVTPASRSSLKVFGSIPYWDQRQAFTVFQKHVDKFDFVALFWYRLDAEGRIGKYSDAREDMSILSFAKQHGVKALALIANLPEDGNWDPKRVDLVIGSPEARSAHITAIMQLVRDKGFDGINIDYEFLQNRQKADFSAFIIELAGALHAEGKVLAVAIHAQGPGKPTRGQDLKALSAADILAFMTYDEHWPSSAPGPIASEPWVRGILHHAETLEIDPKKIYLGMPLFGYDWSAKNEADGLEYDDVVRIANAHAEAVVTYHYELESPSFTYNDSLGKHEVWFENVQSFEAKLNLAQEYHLGGIHLWRLGREDKRIYDVLE